MASTTSPAMPGLHLLPGVSDAEWEALAEQARHRAARELAMANHPAGRRRNGGVHDVTPVAAPRRLAVVGGRDR